MRPAISILALAIAATQALAFETTQLETDAVFNCAKTAFKHAERSTTCHKADLPGIEEAIEKSCGEQEKTEAIRVAHSICGSHAARSHDEHEVEAGEINMKKRAYAPPATAAASNTASAADPTSTVQNGGMVSADPQPAGCTCAGAETTAASAPSIGLGHGPVVLSSITAAPSTSDEGGVLFLTSTATATATMAPTSSSPSTADSAEQGTETNVSAQSSGKPNGSSSSSFNQFQGAAAPQVLPSIIATSFLSALVVFFAAAL